jgi:hypothetical protein
MGISGVSPDAGLGVAGFDQQPQPEAATQNDPHLQRDPDCFNLQQIHAVLRLRARPRLVSFPRACGWPLHVIHVTATRVDAVIDALEEFGGRRCKVGSPLPESNRW